MENGDKVWVEINGKRHRGTVITAHDDGLVDAIVTVPKGHPSKLEGGKTHVTLPAVRMTPL